MELSFVLDHYYYSSFLPSRFYPSSLSLFSFPAICGPCLPGMTAQSLLLTLTMISPPVLYFPIFSTPSVFWVLDQLKKKDWGKYFLLSSIWTGFLPRRTFWFAQTSKAINVKKITHKWKTFMIQMNEVWKLSSGLYGHIWGNGPLHDTL